MAHRLKMRNLTLTEIPTNSSHSSCESLIYLLQHSERLSEYTIYEETLLGLLKY